MHPCDNCKKKEGASVRLFDYRENAVDECIFLCERCLTTLNDAARAPINHAGINKEMLNTKTADLANIFEKKKVLPDVLCKLNSLKKDLSDDSTKPR